MTSQYVRFPRRLNALEQLFYKLADANNLTKGIRSMDPFSFADNEYNRDSKRKKTGKELVTMDDVKRMHDMVDALNSKLRQGQVKTEVKTRPKHTYKLFSEVNGGRYINNRRINMRNNVLSKRRYNKRKFRKRRTVFRNAYKKRGKFSRFRVKFE